MSSGPVVDDDYPATVERRRAVVVASALVIGAVLVGQLLAGDDPGARLDALPETPLSLPLAVWIVVAVVYYLIAWVITYRLAMAGPTSRPALRWFGVLLAANELWNYLLFGFDEVWPAAVGMIGFAALTAFVGTVFWSVDDRVPFRSFLPYLVWVLGYDVPWIVATWLADR